MRYRLQRHDGTDCSATMVPITVLRMVPIQRYRQTGKNEVKNATKRELARVRATAMEGSFGTQKEHYGLRKIAARIKSTEILLIFFGIHTANVVNLARQESVQVALAA